MRAAATRHRAIKARIVKQPAFTYNRDARRKPLHQRAFGFLCIASALNANTNISAARQPTRAIPDGTAVDRDGIARRAFGAGFDRQIAVVGAGHAARSRPRQLFLKPDLVDAGDLVSGHRDDVVDELLV